MINPVGYSSAAGAISRTAPPHRVSFSVLGGDVLAAHPQPFVLPPTVGIHVLTNTPLTDARAKTDVARELGMWPGADGYYAVGGTNATRTGQEPCPPGTACADGVVTSCPAGRYQPLAGQVRCDNACPPGSFCPAGSANPIPCPVGTFSLGLVDACTPCPYYVSGSERTQTCFDDRYCCPEFEFTE